MDLTDVEVKLLFVASDQLRLGVIATTLALSTAPRAPATAQSGAHQRPESVRNQAREDEDEAEGVFPLRGLGLGHPRDGEREVSEGNLRIGRGACRIRQLSDDDEDRPSHNSHTIGENTHLNDAGILHMLTTTNIHTIATNGLTLEASILHRVRGCTSSQISLSVYHIIKHRHVRRSPGSSSTATGCWRSRT